MWELGCEESWVSKNWCFWTVVLEKTLEHPCTARRSNQSILKEISPEYSLEGLMLNLMFQCFGHLMRRTDSLEKTLMLGKLESGGEGDDRGSDGWMASPTWWTWVWASSGRWWRTGKPGVLQFMGLQSRTRQNDWIKLNWTTDYSFSRSARHLHILFVSHPQISLWNSRYFWGYRLLSQY